MATLCYTGSRKNMYITSMSGYKDVLMSIYTAILLVHIRNGT